MAQSKIERSLAVKFGNKLRHFRKQSDLTMPELAKLAHTTTATISRLESGQYPPSLAIAYSITQALNKKIDDFC